MLLNTHILSVRLITFITSLSWLIQIVWTWKLTLRIWFWMCWRGERSLFKNGIFLTNIFQTVKRTTSNKLLSSIWLWTRILAPTFRLRLRFSFQMLNSARIRNFSWLFTYFIRFWIFRGLLTFFFDFSFFL